MDIDFNFGWNFEPDGWKGEAHTVDLPHDFQMEMPWSADAHPWRGFKPMGAARYRKTFATDPAWAGRRVLIDFEGVMCVCDVAVNGVAVTSSEYGYLGFEADITDRLRPAGETNEVEVWATTGHERGSRWYTGGGLYRPVRLRIVPERRIARHGVFVTTPKVSAEEATVRVQVAVDGFSFSVGQGAAPSAEAVLTVRGPGGSVIGEARRSVPAMDYRRRVDFAMPDITVAKPALWDTEVPNLCTAEVRLVEDGREIDVAAVRFGIRKIEFSPDFGFRLNGHKVFLKSMSNHADYGAVGTAQFPRAIERELRRMRQFGFNAVRCSHNPYSNAFYDLADELGMLVVDEFTDKWPRREVASTWMGRKPFLDIWPELMMEWIRRDRNHPSVVMWSLGNELQNDEALAGYDTGDWGVTTYRMMDVLAKKLDPSRPTTVGLFPCYADAIYYKDPRFGVRPHRPPELSEVTDVASFNYRYQDYADYLKWNPGLVIFQSEASSRECLDPYYGMDRDRTVGLSWWGAIEYWGESRCWPRKGWNWSYFSHSLEPRPQAWLIRSGLVPDEPLVRIGVGKGQMEMEVWNDVLSGQTALDENWNASGRALRDVFVFSNAAEVELFLNSESLGRKPTKHNIARWEGVTWVPGRLEARGSNGASHTLETTGPAVALDIVEEAPDDWRADGTDLKYLRIYAVDEQGRRVPDATNRIAVSVEGPATLVVLDDGDHATDELFTASEKTMKAGFMLAILRAGRTSGAVRVAIASEGIPSVTVRLECSSP